METLGWSNEVNDPLILNAIRDFITLFSFVRLYMKFNAFFAFKNGINAFFAFKNGIYFD